MSKSDELLAGFIPPSRSQRGNYMHDRMVVIMDALGNPEDKIQIIHVAGTSGKTSTCYYLAELLHNAGLNVGLTVSPHIESVEERVQVNGRPLDEAIFHDDLKAFLKILPQLESPPTYFEVLIAFAYWYFAKIGVDVAVIETGLGGLFDATNVAKHPSKTCVITDIGIDHVQILGDTIPQIAAQKAGIIHHGNHAFMLKQGGEVEDVIARRAKEQAAKLDILTEQHESNDLPLFQNRNFSLARQVAENWLKSKGLELSEAAISQSKSIQVPARMEIFEIKGKTIVLDGAHNPQKLEQFVRSFNKLYPNKKPLLLTAVLSSGEVRTKSNVEQLTKLKPSSVIVTEFISRQDMKKRSVDSDKVADIFKMSGCETRVIKLASEALDTALAADTPIVVVTGSLYLIFEVRRRLKLH